MKTLRKYSRIWKRLAIMGFEIQTAHPLSSSGYLLGKFVRIAFFLVFLVAIFKHTQALVGYTLPEAALFFLTFNLVDILAQLFFRGIYGIRALIRKILQREGFEVFEAANGAEALGIFSEKGPINLLITDVVMPGMTGLDLATRVQAAHPHCGILYMSGFTADTGVETGRFPPGSHFLQKPFTLGSLLRKAKEVLAASPGRSIL